MWRYISISDDDQDKWPNVQGRKLILATGQSETSRKYIYIFKNANTSESAV
jgi:hypothetical protein